VHDLDRRHLVEQFGSETESVAADASWLGSATGRTAEHGVDLDGADRQ
jgi:hypothetical protein